MHDASKFNPLVSEYEFWTPPKECHVVVVRKETGEVMVYKDGALFARLPALREGIAQHESFARAIERAARREERERCAKVCDEMRGPIEIYNGRYPALFEAAAAIRALGDSDA